MLVSISVKHPLSIFAFDRIDILCYNMFVWLMIMPYGHLIAHEIVSSVRIIAEFACLLLNER